jgi:hypothetical protein
LNVGKVLLLLLQESAILIAFVHGGGDGVHVVHVDGEPICRFERQQAAATWRIIIVVEISTAKVKQSTPVTCENEVIVRFGVRADGYLKCCQPK